jgi:predicted lipoprotein
MEKKITTNMKAVKYIVTVVVIFLVAYNSVYFKKLDQVKMSLSAKEFNAAKYAQTFWSNKLIPNLARAIDIPQLTSMLATDPATTFERYSHALGIGNLRYFLVKGKGQIVAVNEDNAGVLLEPASGQQTAIIATEYIFGNAVRDATGLIDINEFNSTMDFNQVSAELNNIIRKNVLPPFKAALKKGTKIEFVGAVELNRQHLNIERLEVIPVEVKIEP